MRHARGTYSIEALVATLFIWEALRLCHVDAFKMERPGASIAAHDISCVPAGGAVLIIIRDLSSLLAIVFWLISLLCVLYRRVSAGKRIIQEPLNYLSTLGFDVRMKLRKALPLASDETALGSAARLR